MVTPSINLPPPYHADENTPPQSPQPSTPRSLTFAESARLIPYSPRNNGRDDGDSRNEANPGPFNFKPIPYIPTPVNAQASVGTPIRSERLF
jgi:hypothetical protein